MDKKKIIDLFAQIDPKPILDLIEKKYGPEGRELAILLAICVGALLLSLPAQTILAYLGQ